jgi:hypothetical protein
MTSNDFIQLNINDRANTVWAEGEFIGAREYYGYKVVLYVLKGLYVEVWYFISTNKIEKVEPIADPKDLNHYLKDIDLEKLLDGYPYTDNAKE